MQVAIASGKGGTGKTTVAVNLTLAIGQAQVLDCDVEDPDAAIFLQPEVSSIAPVSVRVPRVLPQLCTYCKECAQFCQYNAIVVLPDQWLLTPELCKDCGGCYIVCPEDALASETRQIGVIERGTVDPSVKIITGRLNPVEAMSPPLIHRVKAEARADLPVIIDCPPGSACSMVNSVANTDYCLMVTEPTPFGLHDLEQAVEVVRLLEIPIGVVINRSDLGDAPVRDFCRQQNVPVLLEIPYDVALARAYAQGTPAIRADKKWRTLFEQLWQHILNALAAERTS